MGPPLPQVEAIKQPVQLLTAQDDYAVLGGYRPMKTVLLQALLPQAKAGAFPIEDLDLVTTPVGEHEQAFGKPILYQYLLDQNGQAVNPLAEIHLRYVFTYLPAADTLEAFEALPPTRVDPDTINALPL